MASNNSGILPPKKTKNRTCCGVPGCSSRASNDFNVRFHKFPTFGQHFIKKRNINGEVVRIDRAEMWMDVLNIPRDRITKYTVVCSQHFQKEDYLLPDVPAKKKHLKTIAVPSCNLPVKKGTFESRVIQTIDRNDSKTKKREIQEYAENGSDFRTMEIKKEYSFPKCAVNGNDLLTVKIEESPIEDCSGNGNNFCTVEIKKESSVQEISGSNFCTVEVKEESSDQKVYGSNFCTVKIKEESSGQEVNGSDLFPVKMEGPSIEESTRNGSNFCAVEIKKESIQECISGRDLPTEEMEASSVQEKNKCVKFVSVGTQVTSGDFIVKYSDLIDSDRELDKMTGILNFQILGRICETIEKTYPGERKSVMTTKDKIIMTFMKLKHNFSYTVLCSFFKYVTNTHCTKMIFKMLTKLSNVLKKYAVPFPNKGRVGDEKTAKVRAERAKQCQRTFKVLGYKMPKNLVDRSDEIKTIVCAIININSEYW